MSVSQRDKHLNSKRNGNKQADKQSAESPTAETPFILDLQFHQTIPQQQARQPVMTMTQPSESPQISFRETATPPRFAGLTLPSALRELCAPDNATPKPIRRTEMSGLATRLRKIQLDISPTKDSIPFDDVNPSRLEFGDGDFDKENVTEKTGPFGTAIWGVHDKHLDGVEEKGNDALERAASKMSTHIPGKRSGEKHGIENAKAPVMLEHHHEEGSHPKLFNSQTSGVPSTGIVDTKTGRGSEEQGADNSGNLTLDSRQCANKEDFKRNLQKILDGRNKWPWLERCKAMSSATKVLSTGPPQELVEHTKSVLNSLSSKLNDHLDELRPSVITSALGLVNAIISLKVEGGYNFADEVFPSIMDIACGRSLTAQEAAKSLALGLHHHPELESILCDADNIHRLCEILQQQATSLTDTAFRERAASALELAQKVAGRRSNSVSPAQEIGRSVSGTPLSKSDDSPKMKSVLSYEDNTSRMESPQVRSSSFHGVIPGKSPGSSARRSLRSHHRTSVRLSRTPSKDESPFGNPSPTSRVGDASVEVRNGATVIRNTKLRSSGRKFSPGSMRTQRMYTDEEVEELCRKAMQTAKEEASRAYEKEKDDLSKSRDDLELRLEGESSQVEELKSVLEEYQLTMQTMVAQGNTQISAQNTALVTEKNRLKGELLEVSEAFETLKEKYDDSKKIVGLFEAKENRYIEQIKDLKKNMVELQKWSNDLKANTEKKLSKAFESVTSYRASYMDKEAHAQKAISDLERTRVELKKEQQNHAETAAKFSQAETQLHSEQDARSSAEASLTSTKTTLSRITSHKERLQSELTTTKDTLVETQTKLVELESTVSRLSDMQSQMDSVIVENQSLKARAYDDMTQIKSLEAVVREKDAELEEMSAICEEAMERLERGKLSGN